MSSSYCSFASLWESEDYTAEVFKATKIEAAEVR